MIQKIENNDMNEITRQNFAVVDFSATWCGPCRMLATILEELSDEMEEKAKFYNIDIDENSTLAVKYGIQSIPTLLVMKDGQEIERSIGFMPKQQLKEKIESLSMDFIRE